MSPAPVPSFSALRFLARNMGNSIRPPRHLLPLHSVRPLSNTASRCAASRGARSPRARRAQLLPNRNNETIANFDATSGKMPVALSYPGCLSDFAALGFPDPPEFPARSSFWRIGTELMRCQITPGEAAALFHPGPPEYIAGFWLSRPPAAVWTELSKPARFSQAFYVMGRHLLRIRTPVESDGQLIQDMRMIKATGRYMLEVALELGNRDAAIYFCAREYAKQDTKTPARAEEILAEVALGGNDWEAMALQAQLLFKPVSRTPTSAMRNDAYKLAQRAFDMCEPGIQDTPSETMTTEVLQGPLSPPPIPAPWRILRDMADSQIDHDPVKNDRIWYQAIEAGARKYDDPEACWAMAQTDLVPTYSDEWVILATKAAMAGYDTSSFDLARYYIEQYRWYPTTGKPSTSSMSGIGTAWLELSIAQCSDPENIARRALAAALIYRERNDKDRGIWWLELGIDRIGELVKTQGHPCRNELQYLHRFVDGWYKTWPIGMQAGTTARSILGPPVAPALAE